MQIAILIAVVTSASVYMCMSKFRVYILNVCGVLYVKWISTKLQPKELGYISSFCKILQDKPKFIPWPTEPFISAF